MIFVPGMRACTRCGGRTPGSAGLLLGERAGPASGARRAPGSPWTALLVRCSRPRSAWVVPGPAWLPGPGLGCCGVVLRRGGGRGVEVSSGVDRRAGSGRVAAPRRGFRAAAARSWCGLAPGFGWCGRGRAAAGCSGPAGRWCWRGVRAGPGRVARRARGCRGRRARGPAAAPVVPGRLEGAGRGRGKGRRGSWARPG